MSIKRYQTILLLSILLLAVMLSACQLTSQENPTSRSASASGNSASGVWLVTLESRSGGALVSDIQLVLEQTGEQVSGNWQNPQTPVVRPVSGSHTEAGLRFSFAYQEGGETRQAEFSGLVAEDGLTGIITFFDSQGQSQAELRLRGERSAAVVLNTSTPVQTRTARKSILLPEEAAPILQAELDKLQAAEGFPGVVAAVVRGEGAPVIVVSGLADIEAGADMPETARMPAGSVGKTFVAALVLDLAAQGMLDLDAPIKTWLAAAQWFGRLPNGEEITLRMLLNHSSGLPDHLEDPEFIAAVRARTSDPGSDPDFAYAPQQVISFILDQPALFPAGQGYHYSNSGYLLVGLVIEAATGADYYDLLEQRILVPLGLENTLPADRRELPGIVPGYLAADNALGLPQKSLDEGLLSFNPLTEWTEGGLLSSAADLARWASLLYQDRALDNPYLETMLSGASSANPGYGLGVSISETSLGSAYGHAGQFPGYRTGIAYFPEHDLAIAVQVNSDVGVDTGRIIQQLAEALLYSE